jgi:D-tyrosyl-tRNA(Tyr) deacylase
MIAIAQRVSSASVVVEGRVVGEIGRGLLVLLGVHRLDTEREEAWIADRVAKLRVFPDDMGKMNLSMAQIGGAGGGCLVVPNFTLCAEAERGARPSFSEAMEPGRAKGVWESVCARIAATGVRVERGEFGAHMLVRLEGDGPVTIVLDSAKMPRA